jgi:hypothetical protein
MEENGHEEHSMPEQLGNDSTVTTKPRRNNKPMAVAAQTNGQLTEEEKEKRTREKKVGLLPTAAAEQKPVEYNGKIIQETTWSALKGRKLFSVNSDGSHPYLKLSKSSYYDLVTEEVVTSVPITSQQKVYRIKLL